MNKTLIIAFLFLLGLSLMALSCHTDQQQVTKEPLPTTAQIPAIDRLDQAISTDPGNADLYFKRAQVYFENEGYDEAILDMSRAMSIDSTNISYHHFLTDVYLKYPKSYQALLTMQRVVTLHPSDIPSLQKLSHLQIILQQYNDALATVDKALKIDPQNASTYFLRGLILQDLDREDEAIKAFRFSTELDSDMIDAWIILGQIYDRRNDPQAVQFFDNAIRVDPSNVFALHTKANYLQQRGDTQEAIDLYRKINVLDHGYTDAYYNLGLAYLELDSLNKAYKTFGIAIQTDPLSAESYHYRGITLELQGQLPQAKRDFEQALTLAPKYETAKESLERVNQVLANQ